MRLGALFVFCVAINRRGQLGCGQRGRVTFEALGLEDDTVWTRIPGRRRLVCSRCGTRSFEILPDWSGYRAHLAVLEGRASGYDRAMEQWRRDGDD